MLTSNPTKPNTKKKSKQQAKHEHTRPDFQALKWAAGAEYRRLAQVRKYETDPEKIASIDSKMLVCHDLGELRALLLCHNEFVIAKHVTFDEITAGRYGFTCVISKKGDTQTIPIPPDIVHPSAQIRCAKTLLLNGVVVQAYRAFCRTFVEQEQKRRERRLIVDALEAAAAVADEADDGIEAALRAMGV
jgi:hypothetical protein